MEEDNYKVCFIISHRYYRTYKSYLIYYLNNIQKYYKNTLTLVVDNNSKYIEDISECLKNYKNTVLLINNTECKFEVGAYKVGINYLLENNLLNTYDYVVFSQDNFILKNKFDFNEIVKNNCSAAAFGSCIKGNFHFDFFNSEHSQMVLKRLNLENSTNDMGICWCSSFILTNSVVEEFLDITKDIILTNRLHSQWAERYLVAIIYYFNKNGNNFMFNNGLNDIQNLSYDCWTVQPDVDDCVECFVKRVQQKTENTPDL